MVSAVVILIGAFILGFIGYAVVMRRREAAARRAWEAYCNEQALANDAARAEKIRARREAELDS